jgi:hypothetical protein
MFYLMTCEKQISYSPASPTVEGRRKKINIHWITSGLCPITVHGGEDFTSTVMITVLVQITRGTPSVLRPSARILARSGKKQSVEYAYMPVRHSQGEKCPARTSTNSREKPLQHSETDKHQAKKCPASRASFFTRTYKL